MDRVVLVAVGGGVGSVLRYLTNGLAVRWLGLDFPYGTLIVNVVGSFLIGLVQALAEEAAVLQEPARLFLSVGVMGGFTTYSAFSFETVRLVELDALAYRSSMRRPTSSRTFASSPTSNDCRNWAICSTMMACLLRLIFCIAVCVLGIAAGRFVVALRG